MFGAAIETPLSLVVSPLNQGFIDIHGRRSQYASKWVVEKMFPPVYRAFSKFLKRDAENSTTGSWTVNGWRNSRGALVIWMMWHFVDEEWRLRSIQIASFNLNKAQKLQTNCAR